MTFLQRTGLAILFTLAISLYASSYMNQEGKAATVTLPINAELTSFSVSGSSTTAQLP